VAGGQRRCSSGVGGSRQQADRGGAPRGAGREAAGGPGRRSTPCGARWQAHRGAAAGGCRPPELRIRRGIERILSAAAQTALAPTER
jgi:hypothetical protein